MSNQQNTDRPELPREGVVVPEQPDPNQLVFPLAGVQMYQGPIPQAQDLKAYEDAIPGSGDRIIKMAEREQKGTIHLKWADWFSQFISMLLGKGFLYFLFAGSIYLAVKGKDAAAVVTAIAPVASIVYSTLFGEKKKKDDNDKQ